MFTESDSHLLEPKKKLEDSFPCRKLIRSIFWIILVTNKLWREFQLFFFQFLLDFSNYKNNMKSYEHFPVEVICMQNDVIAMCWLKIANYPMLREILWVYITNVILFVRRNCPSAKLETAQRKKKLLFYTQNWLGTKNKRENGLRTKHLIIGQTNGST